MILDLDALEAAALVVKQHADATKRLDAQMTRLFIGEDGPRLTLDDGTAPSPFDPDVVIALVARLRAAEALIDTIAHRCARFVKGPPPTRGMVRCNGFAVGVDANDCHVCDDHAGTARPADDDAYATALRAWLALRETP